MPPAARPLGCVPCVALLAALCGCFGTVNEPLRRYYTLHLQPLRAVTRPPVAGLLRVRDLDPESAYDRFQMVVRRTPFELIYRNRDVWAVKPNRMVSDMIARGLGDQHIFTSVAREMGERRPDYLLSGELQAIEIYDSGDQWFAHLAMTLQITHFETGAVLWTYRTDTRKSVPPQNYGVAVRALSELVTDAVGAALESMGSMRPAPGAPHAEDDGVADGAPGTGRAGGLPEAVRADEAPEGARAGERSKAPHIPEAAGADRDAAALNADQLPPGADDVQQPILVPEAAPRRSE